MINKISVKLSSRRIDEDYPRRLFDLKTVLLED